MIRSRRQFDRIESHSEFGASDAHSARWSLSRAQIKIKIVNSVAHRIILFLLLLLCLFLLLSSAAAAAATVVAARLCLACDGWARERRTKRHTAHTRRFICCAFNSLGTLRSTYDRFAFFLSLSIRRLGPRIDFFAFASPTAILSAGARTLLDNKFHLCKINVMNKCARHRAPLSPSPLSPSPLICIFSKLIIHKRVHDVCRPPSSPPNATTKKRRRTN